MIPVVMDAERVLPWLLAAGAAGFLLGMIPFGVLVARLFGLGDLRRIGSGNVGATNVLRTGNKTAAAVTLLLDAAKGAGPALIAFGWLGPLGAGFAGLGAFLGHCFSPLLKFKGGKGVATGLGALLAWRWELALLSVVIWALVAGATRYVSAASLAAAATAVVTFAWVEEWDYAYFVMVMALVIAVRHRDNIGRLSRGEESKIGAGQARRG